MFQDCWLWQMFLECVSNVITAYKFPKQSKFEIFGKKMGYAEKGPWSVSRSLIVLNLSKSFSNGIIAYEFSKRSKISGFFENEPWNVSKSLNVKKKFSKKSRVVLLLKKSRNFQKLGFFLNKRWVYREKT